MARKPVRWSGAHAPFAARPVPVATPGDGIPRVARLARFATAARRALARTIVIGGLMVAGWLFAVLFGFPGSAPAAAESTVVAEAASPKSSTATGPVTSTTGDFPTERGSVSVPDNTEAMAGRGVDGLTSQSKPVLPAPSTADHDSGADGFVPHGGGTGQFGPGTEDVSRSAFDPRLMVRRAPLASVSAPVVRTAADEPSFSPD